MLERLQEEADRLVLINALVALIVRVTLISLELKIRHNAYRYHPVTYSVILRSHGVYRKTFLHCNEIHTNTR